MTEQIIKQPNGKYALFSSIADDFVLIDADPQDIIDEWVGKYKLDMEKKVTEIVAELERGEKPYRQFTTSFEEAVDIVRKLHGENTESLKMLLDSGAAPQVEITVQAGVGGNSSLDTQNAKFTGSSMSSMSFCPECFGPDGEHSKNCSLQPVIKKRLDNNKNKRRSR